MKPLEDIILQGDFAENYSYSGGKKNPDLPIKSTENLNMTCRHCKRLVITPTDVVLGIYTVSSMK